MKQRTYPLIGKYYFGWGLFWLLTILLVNALYLGLANSIRGFSEPWMIPFGMIALFAGWISAGSHWNKVAVVSAGVLVGPILQVLIQSGAFTDLYRAFTNTFELFMILPSGIPPNNATAEILFSLYLMMADISAIFVDGWRWIGNFFQTQGRFYPEITHAFWGSLFWMAVYSSGWMLRRRRQAFTAVLPASLLLIGVLGYTRQESDGLVLFLGILLFLMVLQEHLKREERWNENKIDYSEELRFDLASISIPIITLIIIITFIIPNISIQDLRDFYDGFVKPESTEQREFSETFGLERVPLEGIRDEAHGGMPRSHLIGNIPELSSVVIMEIDTGEVFIPPQANI